MFTVYQSPPPPLCRLGYDLHAASLRDQSNMKCFNIVYIPPSFAGLQVNPFSTLHCIDEEY